MSRQILQDIIDEFQAENFTRFFRAKNDNFQHPNQSLHYEDANFGDGKRLEEITFDDGNLIVCSFRVKQALSERSGKKAQYELGKRILKDTQTDAGIFIFYDKTGSFRFSLIYANYLGRRRDWSTFRRFTYFVSPELTNKTFLQRIGDGDFSSLAKIKEAFSVEKVTKEFYEDIANWYFWAVEHCRFPKDAEAEENGRNVAVIRLITRMIFIWFMRERGLVPKELFEENNIQTVLKDTDPKNRTYYRAILQNLFFATLSTKKEERQFREEKRFNKGWNKDFGNQYVFRYHDLFASPEKIKDYFADIPFLNGGLFECLDDGRNDIYIDGFTERKKEYQPQAPNFLFFSGEKKADLNAYYGTKGKNYKVRGLFNILSSFNFTIDENSPDDADIALDPELLGRVFENLLASFNPETSTTARKATGSYYTPREIVDYMVTESLKEYFKTHLPDVKNIDEKLETLFSTGSDENPFSKSESKKLVELIESVRIVDPAVGSGAFPMGALNRMVFILNKIDPGNELWKQAQLDAADAIPDPQVRRNTKKQIEEFFKDKNADYGRKLYLIQKCIYGVDIQQIAVEIAKLRFFISLLVDEKIDEKKENWGVEPLPNLDFKIMQGNSLISEFLGIDFDNGQAKQEQAGMLFAEKEDALIKEFEQKKIDFQNESDKDKKSKLKNEVEDLMIKIFEAKVRKQKADYFRQIDDIEKKYATLPNKKTREELITKEKQKLSHKTGFDLENIEKQLREFMSKNKTKPFFAWKLYFAEVFERGGFDIVIANPPYVRQEDIKEQKPALQAAGYEVYDARADLYTYFYERSYDIARSSGIVTFISSNKWMRAQYGTKLRKFFAENMKILELVDFNGHKVFEATVDTNIILLQKDKPNKEYQVAFVNIAPDFTGENLDSYIREHQQTISSKHLSEKSWSLIDEQSLQLKKKIETLGTPLKEWDVQVNYGIKTGFNEAFIIDTPTKERLCGEDPKSVEILKPILRGRDIGKYYYKWEGLWIVLAGFGSHGYLADKYPAVYKHLLRYENKLKARGQVRYNRASRVSTRKNYPGQHHWLELDNNPTEDYLESFEKEKIVWAETAQEIKMAFIPRGIYLSKTCFLMTGKSLKYIQAITNSKLLDWYTRNSVYKLGSTGVYLSGYYFETVPIPKISKDEQKPFIDLVDKILAITKDDDYLENTAKQAKVREYEKQIDQLVYKLYGLTTEEIKIIEGSK